MDGFPQPLKERDVQKDHEPLDEPIACPIDDLQETSEQGQSDGGCQGLLFEKIGEEEGVGRLIETVSLFDHER